MNPDFPRLFRPVVFRAYKITNEWFGKGKKVSELEAYLCKNDKRLFVERIRQKKSGEGSRSEPDSSQE